MKEYFLIILSLMFVVQPVFAYVDNIQPVLFDQEKVNEQWYDVSDNLIENKFYYYTKPIIVDVSTLVILKAFYDSSTYLLDQKNIWTVKEHESQNIIFKVWNNSVPYIFDASGYYDITAESYDSYGNLSIKTYDGLIKVV